MIHFHIDYLHFPLFAPHWGKTLTTLHGRLDPPDLPPIVREFAMLPLASISNAQRAPKPSPNWYGTVYHGLPTKGPSSPRLRRLRLSRVHRTHLFGSWIGPLKSLTASACSRSLWQRSIASIVPITKRGSGSCSSIRGSSSSARSAKETRRLNAPTLYPVACIPQAWASATVFALVQARLGLEFDWKAGEIRFDRPQLPEFLDELHLRGLKARDGAADVIIRRNQGAVAINITRRQGHVPIVVLH
jgi:hypothetical protein